MQKRYIMRVFTIACLLLTIVSALCAQGWSTDPSSPTAILSGPGEQVLPKVVITNAHYSFFTLFNNASGGYFPQILAFNPAGNHLLDPPTGYMLSDNPSDTWLTDYDLTHDQSDNALITWQDIRSGTNNVYVYKFARSNQIGEQFLWGEDGIALSSDTSTDYANYSPKILNSNIDDNTYVAWMKTGWEDSPLMLQKLSPSGSKLWGLYGTSISNPGFDLTWPQLLESNDGNLLVKYYSDSGPTWAPTRHLKVMKLGSNGIPVWNIVISNAGGISAWNQIIGFESDGAGGAVLTWHDDRNSDNINEIYFSHVSAGGELTTAPGGVLITGASGNQQFYPKLAVDTATSQAYIFYKITDPDQNNSGLAAQLMSFDGARNWGDNGIILESLSSFVVNPEYAVKTTTGATCIYQYGVNPSSDVNMHVRARCLNSTGSSVWASDYVNVANTNSPKMHFDCDYEPMGWIVVLWEDGSSAYDVYGMRLNDDGRLGLYYPPVQNLTAEIVSSTSVRLSWELPPADGFSVLEVLRNGVHAATLESTATEYLLENLLAGTHTFVVRAFYPDNYLADSDPVTITIVSTADEYIPAPAEQLLLCPNPFRISLGVRWYTEKSSSASLRIYNLKGQLVENRTLMSSSPGWNETVWNSAGYTPGIYLLRLDTGTQTLNRKILKKD